MKKLLALITAVSALGFAVPSVSEANDWGHSRIVSYLRCGRPVVANYQVYAYDRCGNPLGRWVTQHSACGCSVCSPRPVCPPPYYGNSGYHQSGHHNDSHHHSSSHRSGVSWQFSFGR